MANQKQAQSLLTFCRRENKSSFLSVNCRAEVHKTCILSLGQQGSPTVVAERLGKNLLKKKGRFIPSQAGLVQLTWKSKVGVATV